MARTSGRILFLNGTSSSGKSSLATALQIRLRESEQIYYLFRGDSIRDMHPDRRHKLEVAMPEFLPAIPDCVAAIASHGNNVIVEDVVSPWQLKNYVHSLSRYEVFYIGLRCSNEELMRREQARSDRPKGSAIGMARTVYQPGLFDLELDTSAETIDQCVDRILARLNAGTPPTAFSQLATMDLDAVIEEVSVKWATMEIVNSTDDKFQIYRAEIYDERVPRYEVAAGDVFLHKLSNIHPWEIRDSSGALLTSYRSDGTLQRLVVQKESASLTSIAPVSES